jgi:hypothetical protein
MIDMRNLAAIALGAALASGPGLGAASAAEPADAAVATSGGPALTVAEQVDLFLKTSPALALPDNEVAGVVQGTDRRPHGEVGVAIGSHGYRSAYVWTEMPLGKTGSLSIAAQETRSNGRFGPRRRSDLAVGLALGGAAEARSESGCRADWDTRRPPMAGPRRGLPRDELGCAPRSPEHYESR